MREVVDARVRLLMRRFAYADDARYVTRDIDNDNTWSDDTIVVIAEDAPRR